MNSIVFYTLFYGQLVGLTYYSSTSSDYQTNYSIAIPVSIIKVFLSQNGIAL